MASDPYLLERLRNILSAKKVKWIEKRMFGGDCFMVDDKMVFGPYQGGIMVRVAPEEVDELLKRDGAEQMMMGAKTMKGFLMIQPEGYDSEEDLEFWVDKCLEFNPRAKSSKKR